MGVGKVAELLDPAASGQQLSVELDGVQHPVPAGGHVRAEQLDCLVHPSCALQDPGLCGQDGPQGAEVVLLRVTPEVLGDRSQQLQHPLVTSEAGGHLHQGIQRPRVA